MRVSLFQLGPNRDSHNERVKLFATSLNAIGLAFLIGGVISPFMGGTSAASLAGVAIGLLGWMAAMFGAFRLLGYIQAKD